MSESGVDWPEMVEMCEKKRPSRETALCRIYLTYRRAWPSNGKPRTAPSLSTKNTRGGDYVWRWATSK